MIFLKYLTFIVFTLGATLKSSGAMEESEEKKTNSAPSLSGKTSEEIDPLTIREEVKGLGPKIVRLSEELTEILNRHERDKRVNEYLDKTSLLLAEGQEFLKKAESIKENICSKDKKEFEKIWQETGKLIGVLHQQAASLKEEVDDREKRLKNHQEDRNFIEKELETLIEKEKKDKSKMAITSSFWGLWGIPILGGGVVATLFHFTGGKKVEEWVAKRFSGAEDREEEEILHSHLSAKAKIAGWCARGVSDGAVFLLTTWGTHQLFKSFSR